MNHPSYRVTFLPTGLTVRVEAGRRLLSVIKEAGLPIGYSCRGRGICTACVIMVSGCAGPINASEKRLLGRLGLAQDTTDAFVHRIACLASVQGHLQVTTTYW